MLSKHIESFERFLRNPAHWRVGDKVTSAAGLLTIIDVHYDGFADAFYATFRGVERSVCIEDGQQELRLQVSEVIRDRLEAQLRRNQETIQRLIAVNGDLVSALEAIDK